MLALRNLLKRFNQCVVRFSVLGSKAGDGAAEIGAIELSSFVDLAGEKALS